MSNLSATTVNNTTGIKSSSLLTKVGRAVIYVLLFSIAIAMVMPFYVMIMGSFMENYEILSPDLLTSLPDRGLDFFAYETLQELFPVLRVFLNSVFVSSTTTILAVLFCSLTGFAFASYNFPGRRFFFSLVIVTLMIPFQALVVPLFLVIKTLGWVNTYQALIIPSLIPPFGIFLMKQYIEGTIPDEVLDSARIDGCSEFQIYYRILLPIIKPGIALLGILTFMQSWNAFLWPLIVVQDRNMFVVNLLIAAFRHAGTSVHYGSALAASAVAAVPILIFYLLTQKMMVKSIMSGFSMKF